jgi:O-antigen ligase
MERKQNPTVSFTLWLPTLWVLLTASKPLSAWFGVYGADIESGSPLDRVVLLTFFFAAMAILAVRGFDWGSAFRENPWLMLLIFFELVSICWSDIPYVSFKRWIRVGTVVPMAFIVLSEKYPRQALQSIFRRTVYILIPFSVLLVKYFLAYGVDFNRWTGDPMWVGVALQKNGLGRLCLFAAFFLIWTLIRRWKKRDIPVVKYQTYIEVFLLLLTLWLLRGPRGGGYPATAIGALVLGLTALFFLLRLRRRRVFLTAGIMYALVIGLVFVGTLTPLVHGSTVSSMTSVFGRSENFTGRTDIWDVLMKHVMQSPILGHGVGGFWTTDAVGEVFGVNEAHNGYLDILLHYGFAGLLLFTAFLLSICRKAHRELAFDYDWGSLWICFLLIALIHNFTESSIHLLSSHLTAVLVFLTVCSGRAVSRSHEYIALTGAHAGLWALRRPSILR